MSLRSLNLALLLLVQADLARAGFSGWDETQLTLLQQFPPPLRWQNVEGAPALLEGTKTRRALGSKVHTIQLQPGQSALLNLEADSWLRLEGLPPTTAWEALEASISTDGRAFVATKFVPGVSEPRNSIEGPPDPSRACKLVAPPGTSRSYLVRLTNPVTGSPANFAAFSSEKHPRTALAPYREQVALPGDALRLKPQTEPFGESVRLVNPPQGIEFPVHGPTRLQLTFRMVWPENEPPREQALTIRARMDGVDLAPALVAPSPDLRQRTSVNGTNALLSFAMPVYLSVPKGTHVLKLQPSAPVYFTARQQAATGFLFPQLNAPETNALHALRASLNPNAANTALPARFPELPPSPQSMAAEEQGAWQLARDNRFREAGAQAAEVLNRLSDARPDYPPARRTAEQARRQRTQWKDLLPARFERGQTLERALFRRSDVIGPGEEPKPQVATRSTFDAALRDFENGAFVRLPTNGSPALVYEIPPRGCDSLLRVAVASDSSHPIRLAVRFDNGPPLALWVQATNVLGPDRIRTSPAKPSLETSKGTDHAADLPGQEAFRKLSAGSSLVSLDLPLPLRETAVAEVPLPQSATRARLTVDSPAGPLAVAVSFRASKSYAPGEATYLSLVDLVDEKDRVAILAAAAEIGGRGPVEELRNQLLPLANSLALSVDDFTNSIDWTSALNGAHPEVQSSDRERRTAEAARLERQGRTIESLQVYNQLFWENWPSNRPAAALPIMRLLAGLGEEFLAVQYARFALASTSEAETLAPAVRFLEDYASATQDAEMLEQVRAFLFFRRPDAARLKGLVEALAANDRPEMALRSGLLLPPEHQPREIMLAAALGAGWWQTMDRLIEAATEVDSQKFWRAQRHLAFGELDQAQAELASAGNRGADCLERLRAGLAIRGMLGSADAVARATAFQSWQEWQTESGDPGTWEEAEGLQLTCPRTALVYNTGSGEYSHFPVAQPDQPVDMIFAGPARLRFETRLLLASPPAGSADDWLEISDPSSTNRIPICQALPSQRLNLPSLPGTVASVKNFADQEWGPGLHRVRIRTTGYPALIRVLQQRPQLPIRILPALNVGHYAAYSNRQDGQESRNAFLRTSAFSGPARLDARGALRAEPSANLLQHLQDLLDIAEHCPVDRFEAQCRAEWIASRTNLPAGARRLLSRLTEDLTWRPLPVTPLSAGVCPVKLPADAAQDPGLRVRHAILPPAGTNQFTVSARNEFSASMDCQRSVRGRILAKSVKAGFSRGLPMTVALQVDDRPVQRLPLREDQSAADSVFELESGKHLLRAWIEDPVANQFVRIGFEMVASEEVDQPSFPSPTDLGQEERFFHLATLAQPVRFAWNGPALLRVDEYRASRILTHYRFVEPGQSTIELPPSPGQTESWYRVFVRASQTNALESRPAWVARDPEPGRPAAFPMPASAPLSEIRLFDYYSLGGQEDGTWSGGVLLAHRRPFEIERGQTRVENEFLEGAAAYRKATASERLWLATEVLARVHRPGDLTFGARERIEGRPESGLLEWSWRGEVYGGITGPNQKDFQAAISSGLEVGHRRPLGAKWHYRPFAGVFGHYLTLRSAEAADYEYVDQDLYTAYRDDHRWGWQLGTEAEYRPWLDTIFRGEADLVSNENLSPDHWGIRVGWHQLLGPVRTEVAYRFAQYLEDEDRSSAAFLHGIAAGVFAERWVGGRHRLEFGVQYRHDWPGSGDSYYLVLRWDFSQGRAYRDYAPSQTLFRELRTLNLPSAYNNGMRKETGGGAS